MMARAWIGIGSNLGDREATLREAMRRMAELPRTRLVRSADLIETEPVGPPGQENYLNGAVELDTELEPSALLHELQQIENALGRERTVRWGPRTLDLDVLLYDDRVIHTPELRVPHPEMERRLFVLAPLAQIAPGTRHPETGLTIAEMLAALCCEEGDALC
jgi:2-amino-4-hydroxy-6-hydroxymethyldihydropteridine diphosphokinase